MPYHTNEALFAETQRLAARAGQRAVWEPAGYSVLTQTLPAVHVAAPGCTPASDRPKVLLTANMHGNEVVGSEVALAILAWLTEPEPLPAAMALLELADVTVVPAINPDARGPAAAALAAGRMMARCRRGNANGVDLNRNFPFPADARDAWHPLSGTRVPWMQWYRGPAPMSEPESRAVFDLVDVLRPRAALALHSVGRLFLYPYCYTGREPADRVHFQAMGAAFGAAQARDPYRVKQSRSWYTILGDMDDWMYDRYGTLAVTVELCRPLAGVSRPWHLLSQLAWMNPPDPEETIRHTAEACLCALAAGVRRSSAPAA